MVERTPVESWIASRVFGGREFKPDALFEWQLARLGEAIEYARDNSRFYAENLKGIATPKTRDEIARLPLITEADIRHKGNRMLCVSQSETARVVTLDTSGTTGLPKRIWFTSDEQEHIVDFFHHGMGTLAGPGDTVVILLPCAREGSVGDLLATGLLRLGAKPIRHGPLQSLAETLDAIEAGRANALVGTPAEVRALAIYARSLGSNINLKSVLLSTDHAPNSAVETIEEQFGCIVFDHYGMTEMGLGGGVECAVHEGYHLRDIDLLFEVVDPISLCPVPYGESGEVVFSTLRRKGMPLIRYRTGDISRLITEKCACGSSLVRLDKIAGRLGENIAIGEGELTLSMLDEVLFGLNNILDFTASIKDNGSHLCLSVQAAALEAGYQPCNEGELKRALLRVESIARAVEDRSLTIEVRVRAVTDWPKLYAGKRSMAVIKERGAVSGRKVSNAFAKVAEGLQGSKPENISPPTTKRKS